MIPAPNLGDVIPSINIARLVRRVKGGSQAWLVQASDGRFFVLKLAGNPQGNRTLVNEIVAYRLLTALGITTPPVALVQIPDGFEFRDDLRFSIGSKMVEPETGPHFGSLCPVNPEKVAIFDFFPARLNSRIVNIEEFAFMFVLDRWLDNRDRRQTIYYRDPRHRGDANIIVTFIDHGLIFGGSEWKFADIRPVELFLRRTYSYIQMAKLTEEAIQRVDTLSEDHLLSLGNGVPANWLALSDKERLTKLLEKLDQRRKRLSDLVQRDLLSCVWFANDATKRNGSLSSERV